MEHIANKQICKNEIVYKIKADVTMLLRSLIYLLW